MEKRTFRTGYVRSCHLYGCPNNCNDFESYCEFIPVMIVPLDEAEMENDFVKGRLQFGMEQGNLPWTDRVLDAPVEPLEVMSVQINTRMGS